VNVIRRHRRARFGSEQVKKSRQKGVQLAVLYEDDAVVVLDKPAGLPAVPVKGSDTASAFSLLSARLKLKRQRAFVVHRIDSATR
jgi:23S rRNA-/tRNA-specific pseudouridylate synthase